jgi:hypothetical protein
MMLKHKHVLWMVVAWFAVLQTITPFIHGHLEADAFTQSYGLHIHEPGLLDLPDTEHTLKNVDVPIHIVGVNQGVIKNFDLIPSPLFFVWFVFCLPLLICICLNPLLTQQRSLSIYLRAHSCPRAPPL